MLQIDTEKRTKAQQQQQKDPPTIQGRKTIAT